MFANAAKLFWNRTIREYFKIDLKRHMSKTITRESNSECVAALQQIKNFRENVTRGTKWTELSKAYSTVNHRVVPQSLVSQNESCEFKAVFPDIVRDLTNFEGHTEMPEMSTRYAKVLQYNVPHGKLYRGLSVVNAYKIIEEPQNQTPANLRLIHILGWCVELLQSSWLITDDIIDSSKMRRGSPCWYKVDGVGLQSVNDAIAIQCSLFILLKKYFSNLHCYLPSLELFKDNIFKTAMGQSLDQLCLKNGKPNLDVFTMNRYNTIVMYKTAYYAFHLSVTLAMFFTGKYDPEMHRQVKTILLKIGHLLQAQDDFLDCFGNPEITGKVGTDITEGKCSWLVVVALQKATPVQKTILQENYGKPNPECEARVRNLYEELGLPDAYSAYEKETVNIIRTHIQQTTKAVPHKIFFNILNKINKREG